MNKEIFENLINKGLSLRQIGKEIGKSQTSVRYWLKKYNLKTKNKRKRKRNELDLTHKTCVECHKTKKINEFYLRQGRNYHFDNCKKCHDYKNGKRLAKSLIENKKTFMDLFDCKCKICDLQSNNFCVYDFHHIDPSEKEFSLSEVKYNFDKCKEEIKKCILVCSNCHREIHAGLHPQYIKNQQIIFEKPELEHKICKGCHKNLSINNYYNLWNKCNLCKKHMSQKRANKIKRQCLDYKGGKCAHCGYNKCIDAIDFHHVNSIEKEFRLSRYGATDFGEKHKKELDKCIALCSNCHVIEHCRLRK